MFQFPLSAPPTNVKVNVKHNLDKYVAAYSAPHRADISETLPFNCSADGGPTLLYAWLDSSGENFTKNSPSGVTVTGTRLNFTTTGVKDAGYEIECRVTNTFFSTTDPKRNQQKKVSFEVNGRSCKTANEFSTFLAVFLSLHESSDAKRALSAAS